jgi:hypothetical protein
MFYRSNLTAFHDGGGSAEARLASVRVNYGELREAPHPRSLDGFRTQALPRGVQSSCEAAEAFTLERERL